MTAHETDKMTTLAMLLCQSAIKHGDVHYEWPSSGPKYTGEMLWQSEDGTVIHLHPPIDGKGHTVYFRMIRVERRGNYIVAYGKEVDGYDYGYERGDLYIIALV